MSTVIGIWIALSGVPAILAGYAGMLRIRRLHLGGVKAWARTVPRPPDDGRRPVALQYTLADGQVLEKLAPAAAKNAALHPGQSVLIWYDPADPMDVLVYGREGRGMDLAFVITGVAFILIGMVFAVFAP